MRLESDDSILDAVLANLPGVAFRCLNDPAWTMLYISQGLRDLAGYDVADIVGNAGLSYADLVHPDDRAAVWSEIQRALDEHRAYQVEYRLTRADGRVVWVWEQARGAFDEQGQVLFLDGVIIDANARVLAERELREGHERFRRLFELEADAVLLVDSASGRILEANARAGELYGYSHAEFLTLTVFDISAEPEDTARAMRGLRPHIPVRRHKKKDGTVLPVEIMQSHFEEGGRPVHLAAIRDISGRVAEEESLRRSREQLRGVLDVTPFPVALVDIEHNTIEFWSKSAQDLLGYSASTAREWHHRAYPDPEYREGAVARWLQAVERARAIPGTPVNAGEYTVACADGSTRDCELYAAMVAGRLVVTLNDVTDRKRAADELRGSEERFRTLVEEAPLGILVQTGGAYRYANRAARVLYGESPGRSLVGQRVLDVTHPDYRDLVGRRMQTVRERRSVPTIHFALLTLDGRPVEAETSAVPVSYEGENGSLVFMKDITDRVRAEQEIRLRDEQLQQAQKMEAIGRLAGGVAHDFNNLLTAVLGYSDLILGGDLENPQEFRADVMEIRRAAVRAKELTSQILAFSRTQPRQPRVLHVNGLVQESEALLRRTLGEDVELDYRLAKDAGCIEVDPGQFTQVLVNLAVNARDAMPGGGRLVVDTSKITHDGSLWMRLTVADTGHGMDSVTLARVFEPFSTTKQPGEGTGLGLATVYGIVTQNGGRISVSSERGAGSVFTVLLASVPEPDEALVSKQEPVAARPAPPADGRNVTILVVEDEPAVRGLAGRVLKQQGFEVLVASDGTEAAVLARDPEIKLDLLLTDVVLPGELQGDGVAHMVLSEHPGIKCMFMSGYPREVITKAGRLAEDVHYLEKPFTPATLLRRVRELLDAG